MKPFYVLCLNHLNLCREKIVYKYVFLVLTFLLFFNVGSFSQTQSDSLAAYGMHSFEPQKHFSWGWSDGVLLESIIQKYHGAKVVTKGDYLAFVKSVMDNNYNKANGRDPNEVICGIGMAILAKEGQGVKYRQKAFEIFDDYQKILRTSAGAVSHRRNVAQLWDDTIYMIGMFLLEMYRLTGDTKYLDEFFDQYRLHKEALQDKQTGFWVHGYSADGRQYDDSCCKLGWQDNPAHRSSEFWGRGNGWILLSLADALETTPRSNPYWKTLKKDFKKMVSQLPRLQDASGLWHQLPAHPQDPQNYLESSCTAMFGYAILSGINLHVLSPKRYLPVVKNAYQGLMANAVKRNASYLIPTKICTGTCIGDKDYYYGRKVADGLNFGIGAYVMFTLKYEEAIAKGLIY